MDYINEFQRHHRESNLRAMINNARSYTSTTSHIAMGWCIIKHWHKSTVTFTLTYKAFKNWSK